MKKPLTRGMMKKPLHRPSATPRKREESKLLAEIRLAIGARPDVLAARINTGLYKAPHSEHRIRSAPTGYPDLPITQLRRVLEHVSRMHTFGGFEEDRWRVYGQSIFIETKSFNGELSEAQKDFAAAARRVGAVYLAPTSVEEVLEALGPVEPWTREWEA